jgi:hypothetical protein
MVNTLTPYSVVPTGGSILGLEACHPDRYFVVFLSTSKLMIGSYLIPPFTTILPSDVEAKTGSAIAVLV